MRQGIAALLLITVTAQVEAQAPAPATLDIAAGESYRYAPSGLVVPATLDGVPRARSMTFSTDHLDEAFEFLTTDKGDDITVFVFRNVSGSAAVWFDRVTQALSKRDAYGGGVAPVTPPMAVAAPGQSAASGLLATWRPVAGRFRSTGAAFLPLGPEWYVEVRYSSTAIAPEAMEGRLRGVVAALGWPKTVTAQPVAVPIADCATPLTLSGRAAKANVVGKDAMTDAVTGAMAAAATAERPKPDAPALSSVLWCRDTGSYGLPTTHGVYRPVDTTNQYLIAFNDAGRGLWVAPDIMVMLLARKGEKPAPHWTLALRDVARTTIFTDRDRLPPPDQALEVIGSEPYASRVATWGEKRNIEINANAAK